MIKKNLFQMVVSFSEVLALGMWPSCHSAGACRLASTIIIIIIVYNESNVHEQG